MHRAPQTALLAQIARSRSCSCRVTPLRLRAHPLAKPTTLHYGRLASTQVTTQSSNARQEAKSLAGRIQKVDILSTVGAQPVDQSRATSGDESQPARAQKVHPTGTQQSSQSTTPDAQDDVHYALASFINALKSRSAAQAWIAYQETAMHHPLSVSAVHSRWLHVFNALLVSSDAPFYPQHLPTPTPSNPQLPPRSRSVLQPLRTVIEELRRRGPGMVRSWEWNSLIHHTARGHRSTTEADYFAAVEALKEWERDVQNQLSAKQPEVDSSKVAKGRSKRQEAPVQGKWTLAPDIVTYNTLLSIAARTYSPVAFQDAQDRFKAAREQQGQDGTPSPLHPDLKPDRLTHLVSLVYYAGCVTKHPRDFHDPALLDADTLLEIDPSYAEHAPAILRRVPEILTQMLKENLEIGIDGLNAAVWVFVKAGRLDVAYGVYKQLREGYGSRDKRADVRRIALRGIGGVPKVAYIADNVSTHNENVSDANSTAIASKPSQDEVYPGDPKWNPILSIPGMTDVIAGLEPDGATYAATIQCLAYQGRLIPALRVFRDMLASVREASASAPTQTLTLETPNPVLDLDLVPVRQLRSASASLETQTIIAFRSIFLGFIRHGVGSLSSVAYSPAGTASASPPSTPSPQPQSPWNQTALLSIFHSYLALPYTSLQSPRFVRTIFLAFQRTAQRGAQEDFDQPRTTLHQLQQAPDYRMMMEYVYERLVNRFEKSSDWVHVKDSWEWVKLREDFLDDPDGFEETR